MVIIPVNHSNVHCKSSSTNLINVSLVYVSLPETNATFNMRTVQVSYGVILLITTLLFYWP